MQLNPYLAQVHDQLAAAAALGDERTQQVAASLAAAAGPAVRLAVLDALSAAADEITAALLDHPGSPVVSVRLDGTGGEDVQITVRDTAVAAPATDTRTDDGDASARISLRLSETLKSDIEQAAAQDGVSVNSWLVRAAGAALEPNPLAALGAFGRGLGRAAGAAGAAGKGGAGGWLPGGGWGSGSGSGDQQTHITGWING